MNVILIHCVRNLCSVTRFVNRDKKKLFIDRNLFLSFCSTFYFCFVYFSLYHEYCKLFKIFKK